MSIGEGIKEIFQGLGVDYLIEGGQTMNPSTEDMLTAIEKRQCKEYLYSAEQQKYHPRSKSGKSHD